MGKASSAKKVARAARAGGSRRPGQRRAIGFPVVLSVVVILGVSLVLFARSSREANAEPRSAASDEPAHWHAAYGFSFCGEFQRDTEGTALVDVGEDTLGIHTHGDGVIHIHPFIDSAGGRNARLGIFFRQVALEVTDSTVTFPDGETWDEAEDTCTNQEGEEVPGQVVIAKWNAAQDAADGDKPNDVFTDDFDDIRFENDREYYTVAFVPDGELDEIPVRPDVISDLNNLSDVVEAPDSSTSTTEGQTSDSTTSTSAGDASTTTTAAPEESTTSTTASP
jgi:hypothetical protein